MDAACPVKSSAHAPRRSDQISSPAAFDFGRYVKEDRGGKWLEVTVQDIHCPACIKRIEDRLSQNPGVSSARVNFTTKRVTIKWNKSTVDANGLVAQLTNMGYEVLPFEAQLAEDRYGRELLVALAFAGFAAGNIMLLSISVWSGASGATRDLFHWLSALIAVPVILFSGRPFYRSAIKALKSGHLNMDVPISLAVLLATAMSLYETINHGKLAYFDAAVMLLFFLLIGRYLDHLMRDRARSAVSALLSLTPKEAELIEKDGTRRRLDVAELVPGMKVAVPVGERIPVDGEVIKGRSQLDCAHVTGESMPELVAPGALVLSGATNLIAPLHIRVTKPAAFSFIADMVRLMETAEQGKARYRRLADRAAAIYAPAVHLLAALTFVGWLWWSGNWHTAMFTAISVLIITCPCALGLAVPAVQVVASGKLFRRGILVKDGAALEKLAEINTVIFDKTGTLTLGRPELEPGLIFPLADFEIAAGLAVESRHPLSRALVRAAQHRGLTPRTIEHISETAGCGLEGQLDGTTVRLGARKWLRNLDKNETARPEVFLKIGSNEPVEFRFIDALRPQAAAAAKTFIERGLDVQILSGDTEHAVSATAANVGIKSYYANQSPAEKLDHIEQLAAQGRKVLMIGDGLNDAPSLAAGHTSMTPSNASDVGRMSAGFVFLGDSLKAVSDAHKIAKHAKALVTQNFALAVIYNMIAVPVAILGFASPLVAAIAMSSSSILVTLNALRLKIMRDDETGKFQE